MNTNDDQPNKPPQGALDLSSVWSRGMALLSGNRQLVGLIAGLFVLLPSALLQFALPADGVLDPVLESLFDPNTSDSVKERAAQQLGEMIAPFIALAGAAMVIAHVGYCAIVALMDRARPTVGEALLKALKAILPLAIAMLVYGAALYAIILVIQLVLIPLGGAIGVLIGTIGFVIATFYVTARLALTLPVIVLENEMNPLRALQRSWRLTSAHARIVFGFWTLLAAIWTVTLIVQTIIAFAATGLTGPGEAATLVEGLLAGGFAAIWGSIYCAIGVALYREIGGPDPERLAASFD